MPRGTVAVLAILFACTVPIAAGQPRPQDRAGSPGSVTQSVSQELTATIEAIDHDTRGITLKDKDGVVQTIVAGPEVKRFKELRVGDTVTLRYDESVVYRIRKAGEAPLPASDSAVVAGKGARPGGSRTQQQTVAVTIKAIDPAAPSITVETGDGRTTSFRVRDTNALGQVKVGDKVEVTLTQALIISVR